MTTNSQTTHTGATRNGGDVVDIRLKQDILDICQTPTSRSDLESELEWPVEKVRKGIQALLYQKQLTSTPDWKYETIANDMYRNQEAPQ